jgi:MFS transporter, DHA1 family, multidrug resistance protein
VGLVALRFVHGAATAIFGPVAAASATSAFITDLARRAQYGAAHGVFGTIYDIGDALGPIAAGLLVAGVGYAHTFQIMAAVALTAAVVFAALSRGVQPHHVRTVQEARS